MGNEIEHRARDIAIEEAGLHAGPPAPQFAIQIIRPGHNMVAVQLNGRYGYIPVDQVERFRADHPEAVVLF